MESRFIFNPSSTSNSPSSSLISGHARTVSSSSNRELDHHTTKKRRSDGFFVDESQRVVGNEIGVNDSIKVPRFSMDRFHPNANPHVRNTWTSKDTHLLFSNHSKDVNLHASNNNQYLLPNTPVLSHISDAPQSRFLIPDANQDEGQLAPFTTLRKYKGSIIRGGLAERLYNALEKQRDAYESSIIRGGPKFFDVVVQEIRHVCPVEHIALIVVKHSLTTQSKHECGHLLALTSQQQAQQSTIFSRLEKNRRLRIYFPTTILALSPHMQNIQCCPRFDILES